MNKKYYILLIAVFMSISFSGLTLADDTIIIICEDSQSIGPGDGVQLESNLSDGDIDISDGCSGGGSYGGGIGWGGGDDGSGSDPGTGSGGGGSDTGDSEAECLRDSEIEHNECRADKLFAYGEELDSCFPWSLFSDAMYENCLTDAGIERDIGFEQCELNKTDDDYECRNP